MKLSLRALCLGYLAMFSLARAQDEGQLSAPPEEIITDFGIEEFIAQPKWTAGVGVRALSGAKASFTGRGFVSSFQPGSDSTTPNIDRIYHDGNVLSNIDDYVLTINNSDGTTTTYPADVTPAGFTNSWTYTDTRQARDDGNLDFHSYSADVVDSGIHQKNPKTGMGVEITVARDMGNITKRLEWKLLFGASLTDIKAHTADTLDATITTVTDTYVPDLHGSTSLPAPVYTGPSYKQIPQTDPVTGEQLYDSCGYGLFTYEDSTVYVGNTPMNRTTTLSAGTVMNRWDLKGAYFTFRAGPSLSYVFTEHLRATISTGVALVYAGTLYTVEQTYQPDTADAVVSTASNDEGKFLAGYFFDASLQYDVSERTGVYAGVTYQDTGSYTQTASLDDPFTGSHANYRALVDLSSLQGFRMGMSFRF